MPEQEDQNRTEEDIEQTSDFEEKMLKRVNKDFGNSIEFLKDRRAEMATRYDLYHRGQKYTELRLQEQYPTDFYADQIDTFVASIMAPLWAKDEPCKLLAGPNAEPAFIEAKQKLHDYQNREDNLKETHRQIILDIARDGIGIAKTDYLERTERVWGNVDVPIMEEGFNAFGEAVEVQTGSKIVQVPKEIPIYKGAHTERIDPQNFFYTVDKSRYDPGPVMIRSFVSKGFFDERSYYINKDEIKALRREQEEKYDVDDDHIKAKKRIQKLRTDESPSKNSLQYIEWQGLVDKAELYSKLGPKMEPDPLTGEERDLHDKALIKPNEKVMCICGVVNEEVVARLDELPFGLDHENIVIGIMEPIDTEVAGNSVGQKLQPAALMLDKLAGIAFKALRASVNRGHLINVRAVEGEVPDINQEAWVLRCLDNPNVVHKILDQPSISKDVFTMMAAVENWGRNRTGIQEITSGRGESEAETLGEVQIVANQAGLRISDPLEMIEDTFVIPVARMRDEINMQFLMRGENPEQYLMEVIGQDGAQNWEEVSPQQIRAHTKFMCESSGREHDRAVVTQQLMQANQIAPNALAAGQAVRLDRGLHDLFTSGFGRSSEEADWWLPAVKVERESGTEEQMDQLMAQNQQLTEQVKNIQLQIQAMFPLGLPVGQEEGANGSGGGSPTSPGQELPQPTDEAGATQSLIAAGSPQVGEL